MSSEATFTYFEGRGYGEIIRLTLCLAKIPFSQKFLKKREDFLKLKEDGKLFFGQLPLLEMDGLNLVQSIATLRYVAEKGKLVPDDPKQRFRMNMLFDGTRDCYEPISGIAFFGPFEDSKEKIQTSLDKYLPKFNQELARNGTGYLVGDSVTLADSGLLELLLATGDYFGESAFVDYPSIQEFLTMMKAKPEVVNYIKTVRQKPNSDTYFAEVRGVLFDPE